VLTGYPLVTATEGAETLTKGQMNVYTYACGAVTFGKTPTNTFFPGLTGKIFGIPIRHGRITGISGTGNVVFGNEITHKNTLYPKGKSTHFLKT
jgi:hypothetical protein